MSSAAPGTLAYRDLVARLASRPPGESTVLTPNARLAASVSRAVAAVHVAAGRASWPAPDVLAWHDWLERLHEEARFDDSGDPPAPLLAPDAERLAWEVAISADAGRPMLVGAGALAREARAAWSLAHDWGIEGAIGAWEGAEDAQAFAGWAAAWREHSRRRGWIDAARLPGLVPAILARPAVRRPATLVAFAFDLVTPAQRRVFEACRAAGIEVFEASPPRREATVSVVAAESPRREIELAARWARARLEASRGTGTPRIGVVVPDLAQRREAVARAFSRVFAPSGRTSGGPLFNLSLGRALAEHPLVDFALGFLDLAGEPVAFERASRVLRSPFLGEGEAELAARARLDAALRRVAPPLASLETLRALVANALAEGPGRRPPPCRHLESRLRAAAALRPPGRSAAPSAWATHFAACLAAAGFPGERGLDSTEHQALLKWHETLARLGALGAVAGTLTAQAARRHLRQACADTIFQAESGEAPVQVLGMLESVGLDFDALWVTGLTDDAWPQSPRPSPFLPVGLQKKAGIPQASAEASLELDRRITESWAGAAAEVVFSHGLVDEERALAASPLVARFRRVGADSLALPAYPGMREALFAAGRGAGAREQREDRRAPPVGPGAARGGTALLADQAACPFRAFARHRLRAEALDKVEPGIDASERGQLLHLVMARLWRELGTHAALVAMPAGELAALAAAAAHAALARFRAERPGRLEGRFAKLEQERLARSALEWLGIDRARAPFAVVQREDEVAIEVAGLVLRGRVDRVDRLEAGGLAVIDYKTGTPGVGSWLGERPDDPQLPLYALAAGEEVRAVAFACLRKGRLGFLGLAREEGLLPGVGTVDAHRSGGKLHASWGELLDGWRAATARLAEAFAAGEAPVDPKKRFASCRHCELGPLCRVSERAGGAAGDDDEPEGGAGDEP